MGFINSGHSFIMIATSLLEGTEAKIEVDNITIGTKTKDELISKFKALLECCRYHNIKLSKRKLQVGTTVIFAGMLIGRGDGSYKPAPLKAKAITKLIHPMTVTKVRSLLGMLNSFKNFIPDMMQLLPNIRSLLRKIQNSYGWINVK